MASWFHALANPARFRRLADALLPWCAGLAALALTVGVVFALFVVPPDYQQGESVRIMYVHVPAAWMATVCYVAMAVSAACGLIWRHPLGDVAARAAAPIGACFTLLALATGSLWGKPMWGTWWQWDARLTSVLVLFFLYLGYLALAEAFDDEERGARAAGILAVVGVINLPIIRFSVEWWNTLHQPASIIRAGKPTIDASMLYPLLVMILGYMLLFAALWLIAIRGGLAERRLRVLRRAEVAAAPSTPPVAPAA